MRLRRTCLLAVCTAVLAVPLSGCNKAPRSVTDIEAENASGPKPAYRELTTIDPAVAPLIDRAVDGKAATQAVLEHIEQRLAQADDDAMLAYGKLLLARVAAARARNPNDCQLVIHGDEDAVERNANARAEHAWVMQTLRPAAARPIQIHPVVIGAALPSATAFQAKPGENPCDAARERIQDVLAQPSLRAATMLRVMGVTVGKGALGS